MARPTLLPHVLPSRSLLHTGSSLTRKPELGSSNTRTVAMCDTDVTCKFGTFPNGPE